MPDKKTILIAEDDLFLLNAYRVKLEHEGYEVVQAKDGEETMKVLEASKPDLMILDLIMPKKDGFAVLEEIKNLPNLKDLPIIIASNLGQQEDINKGMELGAKDYIVKTDISLEDLIPKIREYIG